MKDQHFYAAAVYYPHNPIYCSENLIEFLENACESILSMNPNARLMITGDINQLNVEPLFQAFTLSQLVKSSTMGLRVLDIFATNVPFDFGKIQCVKSDHKSVILSPKQKRSTEKQD